MGGTYQQVLRIVKNLEPFYTQEPFIDAGHFGALGLRVRVNLYLLTEELANFWYNELRRNDIWNVEEPWRFLDGETKMRLQFYAPITEDEYCEWRYGQAPWRGSGVSKSARGVH